MPGLESLGCEVALATRRVPSPIPGAPVGEPGRRELGEAAMTVHNIGRLQFAHPITGAKRMITPQTN